VLNIQFKRNSLPIDDADLLAVIDALRPYADRSAGPFPDDAVLLSKMVFRIYLLQHQVEELRRALKRGEQCASQAPRTAADSMLRKRKSEAAE
jgi:hypothetical protein